MLDCHLHILAGIDDGAKSQEEALEICQILWEQGIREIVSTPHWRSPLFHVNYTHVEEQYNKLRKALEHKLPKLKIHLGAEHHFSGLQNKEDFSADIHCLGDSNFVLIELPDSHVPPTFWDAAFHIHMQKMRPIIAHPERCKGLMQSTNQLNAFIDNGGLLQITLGHVIGKNGLRMRMKSRKLLKQYGQSCFLASDSHNLKSRRPCWDQLPDKFSNFIISELSQLKMR